ncbi:MAG: intradiol ring-cleavage dioxygenase [Acidobacteria bacterium]|nr:intradiol ring-cleavage dioxygenase [Acidobacteriota bacterium]
MNNSIYTRRDFLGSAAWTLAAGTAALYVPGVFAQQLQQTPRQTEGPFYPNHLPLDTDNDLLIVNDNITPAVGTITHLTGRVLNAKGEPVRNAVVEIWQCDNNGAYLHTGTGNAENRDKSFQGFGRFVTGSTGEYYFRTIKPVPYPGRTPHIHYIVKQADKRMLTTQLYIKGFPGNERDGIWKGLGQKANLVTTEFKPIKDSRLGEVAANFEIVLGATPEDPKQDQFRGGPPPPPSRRG